MPDSLIPFHLQAEDIGTFLMVERARDAERAQRIERPEGPSENAD